MPPPGTDRHYGGTRAQKSKGCWFGDRKSARMGCGDDDEDLYRDEPC